MGRLPPDVVVCDRRWLFSDDGRSGPSRRDFTEFDNLSSERVTIINDAFARRYFAKQNPLSKRIRFNPRADWMTVIGVVGNIRRPSLDDQVRSEFYRPYGQIAEYATFGFPFLDPSIA
jgi:hypothetical protein